MGSGVNRQSGRISYCTGFKIAPLCDRAIFPASIRSATICAVISRQQYRGSAEIRLRTILTKEFERRRAVNPRYSLRAMARSVGLEHSTLSQLLRGKRTLTWKSIRRIAQRLRWAGRSVLEVTGGCGPHWNSRSIADRLNLTVHEVNVTLTDLCLFGLPENKGE